MDYWIVVGIETGIPWPEKETNVMYQGHELILRPSSEEHQPTVIMNCNPMKQDEALLIVRRFLSALCWSKRGRIRETGVYGSGGSPINIGNAYMKIVNPIAPDFRADYLPVPTDPRALLALALYREALSVNSIPYQFLGYFKILNILWGTGTPQIEWIKANISKITDHQAIDRLKALQTDHQIQDIGNYLYTSGRCAVAHAFGQPLVDPDYPEDTLRLHNDLPIIRNLAELLIEQELGVKSAITVWAEKRFI